MEAAAICRSSEMETGKANKAVAGHYNNIDVEEKGSGDRGTAAAAVAAAVVICAAGAGILGWWFQAFHASNQKLWMVPVGLIMLGTPIVVCFSFAASGIRWSSASLDPEEPSK
ncbi:hypothetical protein IEQ34_006122 [Dendrobium chrysotoxum]|uniref:Uncharacterized protein n=1 Tax=Dendrobium chrysotoxum TaxID=161865 RepID=A0AAV7GWY4_DENCH|nr:hypothetical protein IEQ34_006122 [Dendrobium chrysotoxum]